MSTIEVHCTAMFAGFPRKVRTAHYAKDHTTSYNVTGAYLCKPPYTTLATLGCKQPTEAYRASCTALPLQG